MIYVNLEKKSREFYRSFRWDQLSLTLSLSLSHTKHNFHLFKSNYNHTLYMSVKFIEEYQAKMPRETVQITENDFFSIKFNTIQYSSLRCVQNTKLRSVFCQHCSTYLYVALVKEYWNFGMALRK